MTFKNDRAPPGRSMSIPEERDVYEGVLDTPREPRREPNIRIVIRNDDLRERSAQKKERPSWPEPVQQHIQRLPEKKAAMLDRSLQARIGSMLRDVFSDVADAPVPERFVNLLDALDAKDKSSE